MRKKEKRDQESPEDFTLQVLFQKVGNRPQSQQGLRIRIFTEHPEDLGAVRRQEDGLWMTPASMWQREEWKKILLQPDMFTVAFNQCCWGALYRKPTRSVSNFTDISHWGQRWRRKKRHQCSQNYGQLVEKK